LMPMLMTKADGRMLVATTPARTPSHYTTALFEKCAANGSAVTFTIRDSVHIPDAKKLQYMIEMGEDKDTAPGLLTGEVHPRTTDVRREYFCEFVSDSSSAIFPEFDAKARARIVVEHPRPQFAQQYVCMDPGSRDNTGILFMYLDFLAGKLVVEDEILLNNPSTPEIAEKIMAKEMELWGAGADPKRVSDVDPRLIRDFSTMYGLQFAPARNKDVLADVNYVRHLITTDMLRIHPRCQHFIRQMTNVIWNSQGNDFWRDKEGADKHFDLVAAFKYGARYVNFRKSPVPETHWGPGSPLAPLKLPKERSGKLDIRGSTPLGKKLSQKIKPRR